MYTRVVGGAVVAGILGRRYYGRREWGWWVVRVIDISTWMDNTDASLDDVGWYYTCHRYPTCHFGCQIGTPAIENHLSSCINVMFKVSSSINIEFEPLILISNVFKMISFESLPYMIFPESLMSSSYCVNWWFGGAFLVALKWSARSRQIFIPQFYVGIQKWTKEGGWQAYYQCYQAITSVIL